MKRTELITWTPATTLPDSDETVLIAIDGESEPIWIGYHDGEQWLLADGAEIVGTVTHWARFPEGPKTK